MGTQQGRAILVAGAGRGIGEGLADLARYAVDPGAEPRPDLLVDEART